MQLEMLEQVRGSKQNFFSEGEIETIQMNNRGDTLIANGLPLASEIVRLGNSYQARTTTLTAPVTAVPTTAALIGLWNGEQDNGKCYIIDSVFVVTLATTANQQTCSILCNLSTQQIPTAIANTITPRPLRGGFPYRGNARIAVGITLNNTDGVASNWFPIGTNGPLAGIGTSLGHCTDVDCKGMFIIPPKGQFSLTAISTAATASSIQIGMRWHEVILPPVV